LWTAVLTNGSVLVSSLLLGSTVFKQVRVFSLKKLLCDASLVSTGYYFGALWLSNQLR